LRYKTASPGGCSIITYEALIRPAIFAHRGSSAYAPENTLAAFKLAVDQHADAIELDTKLSADGHVVVIHDPTVDRTTNGTGLVNSLTLDDLKRLDAGSKFDQKFKSETIPTLEEVFEVVGNQIVINIEIANYLSPTDDLPEKVCDLIMRYQVESSVILSSFNFLALIRAHAVLPKIPLGLLTFKGLGKLTLHSKLVRFGPSLALHAQFEDVTPALLDAAGQAHCRIHAYTVNTTDEMQRLFSLGVDGLFTRDPLLAQDVLSSQRQEK
jgi:glycerophosphoryl diester phosphodiesterase